MEKKTLPRIVMIVSSIIILIGVVIMHFVFISSGRNDLIKIKIGNGETQSLRFENLALIPGDSCEYRVQLVRNSSREYYLHMKFSEIEDRGLKNFARVRISTGNEVIYDELLADAFEDGDLVVPVDFRGKRNTEYVISCYLPIEVGNEAKNAEAVFELQFTASNE